MLIMDSILLGGGLGKRFSDNTGPTEAREFPKQFQMLGNAPVFIHALKAILSMDCFRQVILAFPQNYLAQAKEQLDSYLPSTQAKSPRIRLVAGGERRQDSSYLALEAIEEISPAPTRVLIHDACRPFLPKAFLERIKQRLFDRSYGAWVPVIPETETLKRVENLQVVETVDRSLVQRVQTPQIFEYTVIRSMAAKAKGLSDLSFTDDASLCEHYGIPVGVFEGDVRNMKLTYSFELETFRSMIPPPDGQEKGGPGGQDGEKAKCAPESGTTYTV